MEARSQTAPQAHELREATKLLSLLGQDSSMSPLPPGAAESAFIVGGAIPRELAGMAAHLVPLRSTRCWGRFLDCSSWLLPAFSTIDVEPVPLAEVESAWNRVEKGRRIVFTV